MYYPYKNNDVILTIKETGETLTIKDFRKSVEHRNFIFEFSDGEEIVPNNNTKKQSVFQIIHDTPNNDTLVSLYDNSSVYGEDGDDILIGVDGDDYLYGGSGDDTYIFGKYRGSDTISEKDGNNKIKFIDLKPEDLTVYYPPSNNNAVLTITETGETLTIKDFRYSTNYKNFKLEFKDGRTGKIDYSSASIVLNPLTVVFGIGYGDVVVPNDVIEEIKFEGLNPSDLTVFYTDGNAVLTVNLTGEKLTIEYLVILLNLKIQHCCLIKI